MSKFKTTALAAALALAVSGAAQADGAVTATNTAFAHNVTGGATPNPTATTGAVKFTATAPDILIGRSSGTGQITVEATLVGAKVKTALVAGDITAQDPDGAGPVAAAAVNTVSSAAGASVFQFTVTPPAAPGFAAGDLFSIDNIELQDAASLATAGGSVTIEFKIRDTTTGTLLSTASAKPVLTSAEATTTTITAGANNTVDVLTAGKKQFYVNSTTNTATVELGKVAAGLNGTKSAFGSGAATNIDGSNNFQYDVAADKIDLTLNVPSPAAFDGGGGRFFATLDANTCAAPGTLGTDYFNFTQSSTVASTFTASVPVKAVAGSTYKVCATADTATEIDAQTIGLTAQVNLAGALTKDPASVSQAAFNQFVYNGAVAKVYHFNPASNADQVSYLRLTNTSTTAGKVTIDATCDDATATPTKGVITSLGAGKSILLTSKDVEQGNAAKGVSQGTGVCAVGGKVRLVLTGEFASMQVQNFLRNNTSAGTINTNVNIEDNNK